MFIQFIVYVIMAVLAATAVFASSMPASKEPGEQQAPGFETEASSK